MSMKTIKLLIAGGASALAFAACSSVGGSPATPSHPSNIANNVLQFAVGTANLYGTSTGLNIVATYRQPKGGFAPGDSGTAVNSPTLTLPSSITLAASGATAPYDGCSTVLSGPSTSETGTPTIGSTTQSPGAPCGTTQTSFGQSGGVFGLGIEPWNAAGQGDFTPAGAGSNGSPFQVAPYPVPLYAATLAASANIFTPWGGPPAFQYAGNPDSIVGTTVNNTPKGTAGVSEGIDVFNGIAPVAGGGYTLTVNVPANTGTVNTSQPFTMPGTLTILGTAIAPAYTADGNGGGTFALTMPAGATEAYLEIENVGPASGASCNGWASAATPVYYTVEATASGALTLPDDLGPTAPSPFNPKGAAQNTVPSVCTGAQNTTANGAATPGDQIAVWVIGFDYDAYGISYPNSIGNPSPSFNMSKGSADITISAVSKQVSP
jgi:hypothetical protein